MDWIFDRLNEASTWRGLIGIAMVCGINISPEHQTQLISACMGLIGIINIIKNDNHK